MAQLKQQTCPKETVGTCLIIPRKSSPLCPPQVDQYQICGRLSNCNCDFWLFIFNPVKFQSPVYLPTIHKHN